MATLSGAVIGASIVCMLASICCVLLVSVSIKLYTEIMKEKVILSRVKIAHKCTCTQWARTTKNPPSPEDAIKPSPPPSPPVLIATITPQTTTNMADIPVTLTSPVPIKRVSLREAIRIAQLVVAKQKKGY